LLDERRLDDESYFHPQAVRKVWDAQLGGQDNGFKLWTVLMFQTWLEAGKAEQDPINLSMLAPRLSA